MTTTGSKSNGLSLYLHIPFCERKCVYCDFYSIEDQSAQSRFVDALIREIHLKAAGYADLQGARISTIFLGGGTPSLLTPSEFASIVTALKSEFDLSTVTEFTIECNPGTITEEKLVAYKSQGANRLSFGVQSFHADELEWLSRIHSASDAKEAVKIARKAGFDNVNIDLMFALPGQTKDKLAYSIDEAIGLDTEHISAYNLTVEEGTPLNRMVKLKQVHELGVDEASELYTYTQERLKAAGFAQYEISNYSKSPSLRCEHNLRYWDGYSNYVSFGPSAHEFYNGVRAWNLSSLDRYLERLDSDNLPINNSETPSLSERRTEIIFCGLRAAGIDREIFKRTFNEDIASHPKISELIDDGLITLSDSTVRLTSKGYRFCDAVVVALL